VSDISLRVKNEIAGDLDVAVFLLSQLNRAGAIRSDPRPQLSDLRESGRLEEDADAVMFLWRPDHRQSGTTELIFAKQRQGSAGTVNLTFDRDTQTFLDGGEPIPEQPRGSKRYQGRPSERKRGYPRPGDDLPMDEPDPSDTE
jgi:replicative DNA helicase